MKGTTKFSQERVRKKYQKVKISVHGTVGTTLFSRERVGLKISQSKLVLAVHWVRCSFAKKE